MVLRHPRRALHALAGACALTAVTAGCASGGTSSDAGPHRPDALVADPGAAAAPTGDAPVDVAALDPEAPTTYRPVARPGWAVASVHAAPAARLAAGAPVRYADGVSVTVERIERAVERSQGVGAFPGRPLTALTLRLHNGSSAAVDLSQVVVTTTYGERPRIATPVYETAGASDFTGTVAPQGTAGATYVFALPPGQAKKVSTFVDFDGAHAAATFTGAVQ